MKKQKSIQLISSVFFLSLFFILFVIPFSSGLKASDSIMQDTTKKQSKMSKMDHEKMSGMKSDMQMRHKKMMTMKMTGDPDYDFASMMIEHHKSAVDMSKKEINKGKDKDVKSMAKTIINDQNKEIKELQTYVKKNKPAKTHKGESSDMTGSMDKSMMEKMKDMQQKMQDMKMTGKQDDDYVSMMIMHHQHGIDMTKEYMDKGKDENLKKMAQKIVDESQQQIDKMKDWQGKHK